MNEPRLMRLWLEALSRRRWGSALAISALALGIALLTGTLSMESGTALAARASIPGSGVKHIAVSWNGAAPGFSPLEVNAFTGIPDVTSVSVESKRGPLTVSHRDVSMQAAVIGTDAEYRNILDLRMEMGRFIIPQDCSRRDRVCVISAGVKDLLFSGRDYMGERLRIGGALFRILGCMEEGNTVFIPVTTAEDIFGDPGYGMVRVQYRASTGAGDDAVFIKGRIEGIILFARGENAAYSILDEDGVARGPRGISPSLAAVLFALAGIFLLAGAAGIVLVIARDTESAGVCAGLSSALGGMAGIYLGRFGARLAGIFAGAAVAASFWMYAAVIGATLVTAAVVAFLAERTARVRARPRTPAPKDGEVAP
jgi:putative ABC transport system permease protein